MKKFISAFLSVVMLLSFAMGMNLTVFADEGKTITSASLASELSVYEGAYNYYYKGIGYYAPADMFSEGDILNVKFSDGTSGVYISDGGNSFYNNDDDYDDYISVFGYIYNNLNLGSNTVSLYFEDDNENEITFNVTLNVIKNPVKSLSFEAASSYEIFENTNGYYDDYEDKWYYYFSLNENDKISVKYTNGTSEDFYYNEYNENFVNNKNEVLNARWDSFSYEGTGETSFQILTKYGTVDVSVTIVENPVKSFSLTPVKAYEAIEGRTNEYWSYYAPDFNEGDKITVEYTDGSSGEFVYQKGEIWNFVNDKNEVLNACRYSFEFDGTGETTFEVKLTDYNKTINVPITVVENPVDSFSFTPATPYEVYENTNGRYLDEENETNWYYYAPDFNEGDKITVEYTDGSSGEFVYQKGEIWDFVNDKNEVLNVEAITYVDANEEGEWEYAICLPYYGKTINVPITVVENPVDSFSFTPVNPYEVEHSKGYAEDEDWWFDAPDFNKGDYVTVYFKDGTQDVYTCKEDGEREFYNSNNEMVTVYSYEFSFNGTGTTSFTVTLYEYGKDQQVPVTVVDNSSSGSTSGGSTSGGSTSGGSTSGGSTSGGSTSGGSTSGGSTSGGSTSGGSTSGGSTGGGSVAPAPTTDDSKKIEEQKPATSTTTTTATETQKPATVKVSKTKAKQKAVVVTWNTVENVTGYQVQLATDKKFKKNKKTVTVAKQNASKKTVKKLKSKKKYYVRVRSYKIVNGKKVYGKWSKVKTVKTK